MDALQYFRIEAQEHLEGLSAGLLNLERAPGDAETLKTLFRLAHTLKGSARMVSQNELGSLAHKMEDVLGALRDETIDATEEVISAMLAAVDVVRAMVEALDDDAAPAAEVDPVVAKLQTALEGARAGTGQAPEAPAPAPPSVPEPTPEPAPEPPSEPAPPAATAPPPPPEPVPDEAAPAAPKRGPEPRSGDAGQLRVSMEKIEGLANLAGELIIHRIRFTDHAVQVRALGQDAIRVVRAMNEIQEWAGSPEVRERLGGTPQGESLNSILGRVRTMALKEGIKGLMNDARSHVAQLDQVVSALHDGVRDLRMLPADSVETSLRLVVRDTARQLGRRAALEVMADGIELDKALLEGVREPLAHLVRNAVGHGIEEPAARAAAGKPEVGTVRVVFERQGARLTVTVSDDGQGVDLDHVRELAVTRGFADPAEAAAAEPAELLRFLLRPGFSTASEVTEIAGRGVGLDVVASQVKALKGTVELYSTPGAGTEIRLHLPVHLATMEGFLFGIGGRAFAAPLSAVERVRDVSDADMSLCARQPVLRVGDRSLPYVCLDAVLGEELPRDHRQVVVFQYGNRHLALGVDRVLGVRTMIVKPLPPHVGELPWVSGLTVLASGRPAVILDVEQLFVRAAEVPRQAAAPARAAQAGRDTLPAPEEAPTILVVDDSLSARMMEKGMLEAGGYRVVLASDGEEGLALLGRGGIDLVVSDVEMPHMDGLAMVRRLREQARTRDLPVIIVSSMGSDKDRRRGLEVGADGYLVKGELNQQTLLDAVERLVGDG
jgi:chemotaxis protein histidine kinase CheA/ActR/RegA family two-component response regulator